MKMLATILPVIFMLALGKVFREKHFLTEEQIAGMKKLVSQLMLPIVIFNALITSTFTTKNYILSGVIYVVFSAVLLLSIRLEKHFGTYRMSTFLLSGSEGGMLGYPLYIMLYGPAALSTLMPLDLGNILFAFTFFIVLIQVRGSEQGEHTTDKRTAIIKAIRSPLVIIVFAGLLLNITGLGQAFVGSPAGQVYTGIESLVTAPITALILLSVGFDLQFDPKVFQELIRIDLLRMVIMAAIAALLLTVGRVLIDSQELVVAVLLYFSLPPQFITPIFIQKAKEREFAATMISSYSLVTIAVYIIIVTCIPLH